MFLSLHFYVFSMNCSLSLGFPDGFWYHSVWGFYIKRSLEMSLFYPLTILLTFVRKAVRDELRGPGPLINLYIDYLA